MMRRRPAVITVWDAQAVLDLDSRICGRLHFQPVDVSVDEAADLADDLLGGARVSVVAEWPTHHILLLPPVTPGAWTLRVRAFTEAEAYDALYAAADLLTGRLPGLGLPETYRLLDGGLVPQSSIPSGITSSVTTNEN